MRGGSVLSGGGRYLVDIVSEEWGVTASALINVVVQLVGAIEEVLWSVLLEVAHGNASSETGVVRVLGGKSGGGLGRESVELAGGDATVEALNHLGGKRLSLRFPLGVPD